MLSLGLSSTKSQATEFLNCACIFLLLGSDWRQGLGKQGIKPEIITSVPYAFQYCNHLYFLPQLNEPEILCSFEYLINLYSFLGSRSCSEVLERHMAGTAGCFLP